MDTKQSTNPFDYAEQKVSNRALISVDFPDGICVFDLPGAHGNVEILVGLFEFREQQDERMHLWMRGKHWRGAQEAAIWGEKMRASNPFDRMFSAYLPHGYESLDILPTSDGSRFLSLNQHEASFGNYNFGTSIDDKAGEKHVLVLNEAHAIATALRELLPLIGVPQDDIPLIVGDAMLKLGYVAIEAVNS